jgi:hypothetical protein
VAPAARAGAPPTTVDGMPPAFEGGRPPMLLTACLRDRQVGRAGARAGTVSHCQVRVLGQIRGTRATIREPEPGVRVETDAETGAIATITSFTFEPAATGSHAELVVGRTLPRPHACAAGSMPRELRSAD